ncbi:MAG: MBL fold metallo-hydrolase [Oscillospiraceae bacterium]
MARIYPICSSSEGNSTFIGTRGHGILVDAGRSFKSLKNSLELIDTKMSGIEALFITHEHIDHVRGVEQLMKQTSIPVFATAGTREEMVRRGLVSEAAVIYDIVKEPYISADFSVSAFPTSHDSAQSCGYIVEFRGTKFGILTDTGVVTPEAEHALMGCEAVLLESNHDVEMLRRNTRYGFELKRRILSDKGHLSNNACAEFAEKLVRNGTAHLILGHLSHENNTPDTAYSHTADYLAKHGLLAERDYTLTVAPAVTDGEYIAI